MIGDDGHLRARTTHGVFVYASLGPFCSACAPLTMSAKEVGERVSEQEMYRNPGTWIVVDVAAYRPGPSSPSPCEHDVARQHWFLRKQDDEGEAS